MTQYALALGHWRPGHEILALAHLFIGMEALTPVALRRELSRSRLTEDELARSWGIEERRAGARRTRLAAEVRRRTLFRGDEETATKARKASDGLEHGFLEFARVRKLAADARDKDRSLLAGRNLRHLSSRDAGTRRTDIAAV